MPQGRVEYFQNAMGAFGRREWFGKALKTLLERPQDEDVFRFSGYCADLLDQHARFEFDVSERFVHNDAQGSIVLGDCVRPKIVGNGNRAGYLASFFQRGELALNPLKRSAVATGDGDDILLECFSVERGLMREVIGTYGQPLLGFSKLRCHRGDLLRDFRHLSCDLFE